MRKEAIERAESLSEALEKLSHNWQYNGWPTQEKWRALIKKAKALESTDTTLLAPKEWHDFAEAMFAKAQKHLKKYPEDKVDAWNDPRFDLEFWQNRAHDEDKELDEAIAFSQTLQGRPAETELVLNQVMHEALDKGNMALFIYFYAKKLHDAEIRKNGEPAPTTKEGGARG